MGRRAAIIETKPADVSRAVVPENESVCDITAPGADPQIILAPPHRSLQTSPAYPTCITIDSGTATQSPEIAGGVIRMHPEFELTRSEYKSCKPNVSHDARQLYHTLYT